MTSPSTPAAPPPPPPRHTSPALPTVLVLGPSSEISPTDAYQLLDSWPLPSLDIVYHNSYDEDEDVVYDEPDDVPYAHIAPVAGEVLATFDPLASDDDDDLFYGGHCPMPLLSDSDNDNDHDPRSGGSTNTSTEVQPTDTFIHPTSSSDESNFHGCKIPGSPPSPSLATVLCYLTPEHPSYFHYNNWPAWAAPKLASSPFEIEKRFSVDGGGGTNPFRIAGTSSSPGLQNSPVVHALVQPHEAWWQLGTPPAAWGEDDEFVLSPGTSQVVTPDTPCPRRPLASQLWSSPRIWSSPLDPSNLGTSPTSPSTSAAEVKRLRALLLAKQSDLQSAQSMVARQAARLDTHARTLIATQHAFECGRRALAAKDARIEALEAEVGRVRRHCANREATVQALLGTVGVLEETCAEQKMAIESLQWALRGGVDKRAREEESGGCGTAAGGALRSSPFKRLKL